MKSNIKDNGELIKSSVKDDIRIIENNLGDKKWYKNEKLHRDGDLPAIINTDGTQAWYKDGEQQKPPSSPNTPSIFTIDGVKGRLMSMRKMLSGKNDNKVRN